MAPFPASGNSESVIAHNFASTGKDMIPPGLSMAEGIGGADLAEQECSNRLTAQALIQNVHGSDADLYSTNQMGGLLQAIGEEGCHRMTLQQSRLVLPNSLRGSEHTAFRRSSMAEIKQVKKA